MNHVYTNIDHNNSNKECKVLIKFDDITTYILGKTNFQKQSQNYLFEIKNSVFYLYLLHNDISLFQNIKLN